MKNFMEPRSVALIGVSRKTGPGSFNIMERMLTFGYAGQIFPVNPGTQEILGRKAYPKIGAVNQEIDLAVIMTPRETTIDILRDCLAAKVKAAIVVNQGFGDADHRGKEIQKEMTAMAKRDGIRILGPNTLGVVNNFNQFTTSFMPITQESAPIGLICQSGILFVGSQRFSVKIGKGIDLGNACDVGFCDALKYFEEDADIKVIAIHMEGLEQGRAFVSLAGRVARKKPIVIYKTGSSEAGGSAAMSHSGSMAGTYQVYKAAFRQAGVTLLEEGGQMFQAIETLLHLPPMEGNRIGVITYSGGAAIMGLDGMERHGLRLATLSPETIRAVEKLSPEWMPIGNPLDIWPAVMLHGAHEACATTLKAVINDPDVDGILFIAFAPSPVSSSLDLSSTVNSVLAGVPSRKPVVAWLYGPGTETIGKKLSSDKRILAYPTPETATWALSLLRNRHEKINRGSILTQEAHSFVSG